MSLLFFGTALVQGLFCGFVVYRFFEMKHFFDDEVSRAGLVKNFRVDSRFLGDETDFLRLQGFSFFLFFWLLKNDVFFFPYWIVVGVVFYANLQVVHFLLRKVIFVGISKVFPVGFLFGLALLFTSGLLLFRLLILNILVFLI